MIEHRREEGATHATGRASANMALGMHVLREYA